MLIRAIVWLDHVIDKLLTKHSVRQTEVRDILTARCRFRFVEKGHRPGENVYAAMGQTAGGRRPIVFFVFKKGGKALILTARDMTKRERRLYEKKEK